MITPLLAVPRALLRYFRVFRDRAGNRLYVFILLTAAMSYAEGLGIALFFPLLAAGANPEHPLSRALGGLLRALHVEPTPLGVLPFIVVAFVLKGLLQFAAIAYQYRLHARVTRELRRELVERLCDVDYRAVVGTDAGRHASLLVNEVDRYGDAFMAFGRIVPPLVNVVLFALIVLLIDWRLTLAFAVLGIASATVLHVSSRLLAEYSRTSVIEHAALVGLLVQIVQGFKYLRTRSGFAAFSGRVDASSERLAGAQYRTALAQGLTQSLAQPLAVVVVAGILYYVVALRGEPVGPLLVVLAYFFRIIGDLWAMQLQGQYFYGHVASVDAVRGALDFLEANPEPRGRVAFAGLSKSILLRGVAFEYVPGRTVLRSIDLEIPARSAVAIVGRSGAGKTTLVDLLTGTLRPASGTITLDGQPLADFDPATLRERIGMVPQDPPLFDDTVANNITLWGGGSEAAIADAARLAQCLPFIEALPERFASRVGERGVKLSGGQRQRLAIARELYRRPDLLVLDEATSSLDSESERAIQESLRLLRGRVTLVVIAHRLSTVRDCDRIFVLEDGTIAESGTFEELSSRPGSRFRRMCELQELR